MVDEPNWEFFRGTPGRDFLTLHYSERQFALVVADVIAQAHRSTEHELVAVTEEGWKKAVSALAQRTVPTALNDFGIEVFRAYRKAREQGLDILMISRSESRQLTFPVGHPRDRVLYVGHPADPLFYVPMADFHRILFEHKVAEALHLLISLGATDVEVEHVSGWESTAEVGVGVSDVTVKAGKSDDQTRRVMGKMKLRPHHIPEIPKDLVWYDHESLWKEVARARLDAGLESFEIDIRYTDDFGVNAKLSVKVEKSVSRWAEASPVIRKRPGVYRATSRRFRARKKNLRKRPRRRPAPRHRVRGFLPVGRGGDINCGSGALCGWAPMIPLTSTAMARASPANSTTTSMSWG